MNRAISSLLVVGVCAVGYAVVRPADAAIVRSSPYIGKFVGRIPGSAVLWPITISSKGDVTAAVTERQSQLLPTDSWGSFSGTVSSDGLLHCNGVQFVRNSAGGFVSFVLGVEANATLNASGDITCTSGTGEQFTWARYTTSAKGK